MDFNDFTLTAADEPPYSLEAEQTVLGAVLIEPDALSTVITYVKPESFYVRKHRDLFTVIMRQFTLGVDTDVITVLDEAVREGIFDSSSAGKEYLASLADMVPSTKNIESYCKIVDEKYCLRQLLSVSREIIGMARGSETAANLLDYAEQKIYDIRRGKDTDGLTKIDEVIVEAYDELAKKSGPDKALYMGSGSGFSDIDHITSGLNKSDLVVIAARPGMGKTSLALNIAANVCRNHADKEVVIFSFEMSKEQLVMRMLASESMVSGDKLIKGNIREDDWTKLGSGAARLSEMNIYFDDTAGISVAQMKAKLRRLKNVSLVIIDYLQLMSLGDKYKGNRVLEISEITRQLKLMAKELNVPVVALSQLSRGVESRPNNKRPVLSDLRDSGSIEQDADIVLFLYRDGYYNSETPDPTLTECIIAKNRHGETGIANLRWNAQYTLFLGMERHIEPV